MSRYAGWSEEAIAKYESGKKMAAEPIAAERDELKACLELLEIHPKVAFAYRANTGMSRFGEPGSERYVRFGPTGQPDITGLLVGGRRLDWEVKRKGKKPTPDQNAFLARSQAAGGFAGWGTMSDLKKALDEL